MRACMTRVATLEPTRLVSDSVRRPRTRKTRRLTKVEALILAVVLLFVVAAAILPLRSASAPAWQSSITVKVAPSQTLWGIARSHPVDGQTTAETVEAIREVNGLVRSDLSEGQLLLVPGDAGSADAMASR